MSIYNHLRPELEGDNYGVLNEEEIARIEARCDTELPEDYKSFLRKFGLCYAPSSGQLTITDTQLQALDAKDGVVPIYQFEGFSIKKGRNTILAAVTNIYSDEKVAALPIANDGVGGIFYLGLMGVLKNRIIFMFPGYDLQPIIANSFTEFMEKVKFEAD